MTVTLHPVPRVIIWIGLLVILNQHRRLGMDQDDPSIVRLPLTPVTGLCSLALFDMLFIRLKDCMCGKKKTYRQTVSWTFATSNEPRQTLTCPQHPLPFENTRNCLPLRGIGALSQQRFFEVIIRIITPPPKKKLSCHKLTIFCTPKSSNFLELRFVLSFCCRNYEWCHQEGEEEGRMEGEKQS